MREFKDGEYISRITGSDFRDKGLLWLANTILHTFGVALVWNPDTDEIYPAYTKFRGFAEENNTEGYQRVSKYLSENIGTIEKETTS